MILDIDLLGTVNVMSDLLGTVNVIGLAVGLLRAEWYRRQVKRTQPQGILLLPY